MASKWVKATFLVILGIVILFYADGFVEDLKTNFQDNLEVAFTWTWDLLTILLWILVAWLFIDAALIIALSFSEHRYSLMDVMKRLQRIEKRLGVTDPLDLSKKAEPESESENAVEETPEEEIPPPPRE
jgi:predicted RND superfamily exporter protein